MIRKSRGSEVSMQGHPGSDAAAARSLVNHRRPGFWAVLSAALALLLLAPSAFAQDSNPRVTFFGGGSFLKGERSFTIGGDPKRSEFAAGGKFGVRGTMDLNDHWAAEAAYSYGTNNLRIQEIATPIRERDYGVRVHQLTGNLLYLWGGSHSRFRPFLTAGAGLSRFNPTSEAKSLASLRFVDEPAPINSNSKFNFNYGGGVEARAGDVLGIRFDLRDHLSPIPRFGVPEAPTAGVADFFPVSGMVHDVEASVGIVIYFHR